MVEYLCPSGHVLLLDQETLDRLPGRLSIGSHGYAQMWDGEVMLLHRWLLGLKRGDRMLGDHINRNKLDNRLENLRVVTPSESNMNREIAQRDLPLGVYRAKKRYQASIKRNRLTRFLGTFDTPEEAKAARDLALASD